MEADALEAVLEEDIADERSVGRSRMSERRSILRERRRALRRRSSTSLSPRVL